MGFRNNAKWCWVGIAAVGVLKFLSIATVVAAAVAFSFSFGDKASIKKCAVEAAKKINEGNNDQAVQYTDGLVKSLEEHIAGLEQQEKTIKNNRLLYQGQVNRQVAELLRANVRLATQQITKSQWLANYRDVLNQSGDMTGKVIAAFWILLGGEMSDEQMLLLINSDLELENRGLLSLLFANKKKQAGFKTVEDCVRFYNKLLMPVKDANVVQKIISQYIEILDHEGQNEMANRILDNFIAEYSDTKLAVASVSLRLGSVVPGSKRDEMIIGYAEKYASSAIGKKLIGLYVRALAHNHRISDVIAILDNNGELGKTITADKVDQVLADLSKKAMEFPEIQVATRYKVSQEDKNDDPEITELNIIYARLAQKLYESGAYTASIKHGFVVLQEAGALPLNLITKLPLYDPSDISAGIDATETKLIAQYINILIARLLRRHSQADQEMQELSEQVLPAKLRPYVFLLQSQIAAEKHDYKLATNKAEEALAEVPGSFVLLYCQQQIVKSQKLSLAEVAIKKELRELHDSVGAVTGIDATVEQHNRCAQLHMALGEIEQAIDEYMQIAEKYPGHAVAPEILAECISILEQIDQEKYIKRIKYIKGRLLEKYPRSSRARKYCQPTSKI